MTMSCGLLEGYSCRYVILVLGVRVQDVAALLGVTVGAAALGIDTRDTRGAIVVGRAGCTGFFTDDLLATTIETFLEVSHVYWTRNGDYRKGVRGGKYYQGLRNHRYTLKDPGGSSHRWL